MEDISNIVEELNEEFPELDRFINAIYENDSYKCKYENECLCIFINHIGEYMKVHKSQLEKLNSYEKADKIPSLKYLDSYGIKFKTYYEICLLIENPYAYISWGDSMSAWPDVSLNFEIDKTQFEISPMSEVMVLLMENIYSENNTGHYQFDYYATMKMIVPEGLDYKTEFNKGLYLLNSHYMKEGKFKVKLFRLELRDLNDDDDDYETLDYKESFSRYVLGSENTPHKNFKNIEPLNLYNEACNQDGEQRFLLLYRILEFFIWRAIIQKIKDIRKDNSISEEVIYNTINMKNEEEQLNNLLKESLSNSIKTEIVDYCKNKELINSSKFEKVCEALYQYRNSLVHAKETEIYRMNIPDPFVEKDKRLAWIKIVDQIALECIDKYNIIGVN